MPAILQICSSLSHIYVCLSYRSVFTFTHLCLLSYRSVVHVHTSMPAILQICSSLSHIYVCLSYRSVVHVHISMSTVLQRTASCNVFFRKPMWYITMGGFIHEHAYNTHPTLRPSLTNTWTNVTITIIW